MEQRPRAGAASNGLSPRESATDSLKVTVGRVGPIITEGRFVAVAVIGVHVGVVIAVFGRGRGLDAISEALVHHMFTIKTMVQNASGESVHRSAALARLTRIAERIVRTKAAVHEYSTGRTAGPG